MTTTTCTLAVSQQCTYECDRTLVADGINATSCGTRTCAPQPKLSSCEASCAQSDRNAECTSRAISSCAASLTLDGASTPNCNDFTSSFKYTRSADDCFGVTGSSTAEITLSGCTSCNLTCTDPGITDSEVPGIFGCDSPTAPACFGDTIAQRRTAVAYQYACSVTCPDIANTEEAACESWDMNVTCLGVHGAVIDNCGKLISCVPTAYSDNATAGLSVNVLIAVTWVDISLGVTTLILIMLYLVWCGKTQFYDDGDALEAKAKAKEV